MKWKLFKSRPNKFIGLLLQQTSLTIEGLEIFEEYLEKRDSKVAKQVIQRKKKQMKRDVF